VAKLEGLYQVFDEYC